MKFVLYAFASQQYDHDVFGGIFPSSPEGLEQAQAAAEEARKMYHYDDTTVYQVPFGVALPLGSPLCKQINCKEDLQS